MKLTSGITARKGQLDHAINTNPRSRWAENELREAQTRLQLGLAASTGAYKVALWVRQLEHLKTR